MLNCFISLTAFATFRAPCHDHHRQISSYHNSLFRYDPFNPQSIELTKKRGVSILTATSPPDGGEVLPRQYWIDVYKDGDANGIGPVIPWGIGGPQPKIKEEAKNGSFRCVGGYVMCIESQQKCKIHFSECHHVLPISNFDRGEYHF